MARRHKGPARPRPHPERAPVPRSLVLMVFVATVVAATLERWWFGHAWHEADSVSSAFYYGDAARLVDQAVAIVQGRTIDNGIPFHPPGWPFVLAQLLRVTGPGHVAVKFFVASLSALTVGCAALLACEIAGLEAMIAVALLGTFHFGHIVEGTVAGSEALYGLLLVATMWAAWRWLREDRVDPIWWAVLAGAVGGYALLVRPEFLACVVVLLAMAWRRERRTGIAAFTLACLIVLVPTTISHWQSLSVFNAAHAGRVPGPLPRFAPITSYGPFNFAVANHERADGGPNRDHPLLDQCGEAPDSPLANAELDLSCPGAYELYVHGYRVGATWLLTNPSAALALVRSKIAWTAGFLAHGYLIDDLGAGVEGTRRRVDLVDPARWGLVPIHLALVAGGVFVLRRRRVALGVVMSVLIALVGSVVLFYGYVRLGVTYLPAVWILQGAALGAVIRSAAGRPRAARVAAVAGVVTLGLLVYEGVRAGTPRRPTLNGERTVNGALNEDETVEIRLN